MQVRRFIACHQAAKKCEGFTMNSPSETRKLMERFVERNIGVDKLWEINSHITCNNYFVDEKICHWLGRRGYGFTGTLSKTILLKGVKNKYLHAEKIAGTYTYCYHQNCLSIVILFIAMYDITFSVFPFIYSHLKTKRW